MSFFNISGSVDATSVGTGGEIESAFERYMGPPNQHAFLNLDCEGKNPAVSFGLPMAYWGKSLAMQTLLEHEMVSKSSFYTKVLPLRKTDDLNVSWDVLRFDNQFFEVEPVGGSPNYIQSSREAHSDKLLNRSMAFVISHGFWRTAAGQLQYKKNFEVLESSARLTINQLVIAAFLRCKNEYRNWEMRYKNPVTTIVQALRTKKLLFACLNRGMDSFRGIHADMIETMRLNGSNPNAWIFPPKTKILMTHMHPSETEFSSGGNVATETRKIGADAVNTFRGVAVYETEVFSNIISGGQANPLRRVREYGSMFWITNYHKGSSLENYKNEERFSARILDASKDNEQKISGKTCFKLSGRFETDGSLSRAHHRLITDTTLSDLRRRMGEVRTDNRYIDMFIGYDVNRGDTNSGFYVMDYFGDMWEEDVSMRDITDFATTAANKIYGKNGVSAFSYDELRSIENAGAFMDDLNKIDFGNLSHKRYLQAVAISGRVGENAQAQGEMFKNNGHGCINPPVLTNRGLAIKDGGDRVLAFRNDGTVRITAANEDPVVLQGTEQVCTERLIPLGYGSPAGLKTLASMYRKRDQRGYDDSILAEASKHYETLEKFFHKWEKIFPKHELAEERACPSYFRSGDSITDQIYAFALNLYDKARYPSFAIIPGVEGNVVTWGADAQDRAEVPPVVASFDPVAGRIGATNAALLDVYQTTDSSEVKHALLDSKTPGKLDVLYRSKAYKAPGAVQATPLIGLIPAVLAGIPAANHTKVITAVIELLLRDKPVDWATEIAAAVERPVRIAATNLPLGTSRRRTDVIYKNSRLCISPESYRFLAAEAQASADGVLAGFARIPIRPMNPFNPNVPLGLFDDQGQLGLDAVHAGRILPEVRFAAAPKKRNTISSLTTSPLFAAHLSDSSAKRSSDHMDSHSSAPRRNRLFMSSVPDEASRQADVASGLPNGGLFSGTPRDRAYPTNGQGQIPVNIALDQAYQIFTTEVEHAQLGGAHRLFRNGVISRFHRLSNESNAIIRIMAQSWVTSKINLKNLENWWDQDCVPLVSFEINRFRQRYYMGSGLLVQGGEELGNSLHGFHEFAWADDIIRREHTGHYSFRFAAVIRDPKKIVRAEDIVAMGYIGGEDISFIRDLNELNILLKDPDNAPGSMIVKMVPYNRDVPMSPQDIGGRYNACIVAQCAIDGMSEGNPVHGNSAYFYNSIYGLDKINSGLLNREVPFKDVSGSINTIVWLGHHRIFNINKQDWSTIICDDGYFGSNIYPGCIADRDINGKPIRDMQFASNCDIFA